MITSSEDLESDWEDSKSFGSWLQCSVCVCVCVCVCALVIIIIDSTNSSSDSHTIQLLTMNSRQYFCLIRWFLVSLASGNVPTQSMKQTIGVGRDNVFVITC